MHVFCALLFATGLQALLLEEGSTGCDSFSILTLSANVDAPAGGAPRPESGRGAMADLVCLRLQITLYLYDAKMNFRMLTDGFDPRQKGRQGQKLDEGRGAMAVPGQPPSAAFADIVKSKPTCLSADGTPQPAAGRGARRDGGPAHPAGACVPASVSFPVASWHSCYGAHACSSMAMQPPGYNLPAAAAAPPAFTRGVGFCPISNRQT